MSEVTEILKKYLARKEDVDMEDKPCCPFVTISRQCGVSGHELGREIIRELDDIQDHGWNRDWELLDQKLCALLVKEGHLQKSFDSLVKEEYHRGMHQAIYEMFTGHSEEYTAQRKIAEVIRFIATMGKAVIIGRGGSFVARGLPLGVHIRMVAPEAPRLARIMADEQLDAKAARTRMHKFDHERATYIHDMYGRNIDDPLMYDIVFNTANISMKEMARAVVTLLEVRMQQHAQMVRKPSRVSPLHRLG